MPGKHEGTVSGQCMQFAWKRRKVWERLAIDDVRISAKQRADEIGRESHRFADRPSPIDVEVTGIHNAVESDPLAFDSGRAIPVVEPIPVDIVTMFGSQSSAYLPDSSLNTTSFPRMDSVVDETHTHRSSTEVPRVAFISSEQHLLSLAPERPFHSVRY